jgi:hypothetical protein
MHEFGLVTRVVDYSLGATGNPNLSSGDVLQMVRVPKGAAILDVRLVVDQLSGGNYTLTVGDGNSAARYFGSLSTGSTSAIFTAATTGFVASSMGYSYSAEDTIDITVGTATTATASGVIRLSVTYTMENQSQ